VENADLARMKWIALALLLGAGALYLAATSLHARHPAWGYVAAFSEAAMVGAIADWFAVVALFRHPLNLPIPHTAIIPSNKDRIGEKLATFICANFLSTSQVLDRIERFRAATRLANWLADPHHAEQMATHLGSALHYALGAMDDQRVRHFFRATLLDQLEKVDIARLTGQLLDVLTTDRRHQDLLDLLLRKLASVLDDETLKQRMAEIIAAEVAYLRFVGLDVAAGRYATSKIVAGVVRLVGEMADDAAHPLRLEFDGFVASFIARLKQALAAKVKAGDEDLRPLLLSRLESGTAFVGDTYLHDDQDEKRARALANQALESQKSLTEAQIAALQASCAEEGARLLAEANGLERAVVKRLARKRMDRMLGS